MKQLHLILLAVFLPLSVFATTTDNEPQNRQEIPLHKTHSGNQENHNRQFIPLPIECCYDGFSNLIQTNVTSNLGDIMVEVLNTFTGETLCTIFDSEITPVTYTTISGASGTYIITYTTESGDTYEGLLNLY